MNSLLLRIIFICLIFIDSAFSFLQHYQASLDGDIANIVFGYPEVMKDPFGLGVLLDNKIYSAPNRFFTHWSMSLYFKNIPNLLQNFLNPIDSIYFSCAIVKTGIQLFITWMLAAFISGTGKLFNSKFLLAAILIIPLFQTFGYNMYMGIIIRSITYTFFYPMPLGFLMLFFLLFYMQAFGKIQTGHNIFLVVVLMLLAIALPFSGPLIPPVVLIGVPLIIIENWLRYRKEHPAQLTMESISSSINQLSKPIYFILIFIWLASLYSIYIGRNNAENLFYSMPILKRYASLPIGLYYSFTQKLGMPLLLLMIITNTFFLFKRKATADAKHILHQLKWIIIFSIIYIALLPLGGYRDYRPNIVRSDTLMPIILLMMYFYGRSSFYLLNLPKSKINNMYAGAIIIFLIIFSVADKSCPQENSCERNALQKISASSEKIVFLDNDCNVMAWEKMYDFERTDLNGMLLEHWGVTNEKKFYYQK